MPSASRVPIRRSAAVAVAVAAALALTACVDGPPSPEPSTPVASPTPTTTPGEPTVLPTDDGAEPLGISCSELVDADAVYAFDPNFALLDSWTPEPGTAGADAVAAGGIACHLVRESGSGSIDISAAQPGDTRLEDLKNAAFAESQMVPTYGDEAYFETDGGVGTAIVFQGPYWLVVSSEAFAEPGEPTGIIDAALAALADR